MNQILQTVSAFQELVDNIDSMMKQSKYRITAFIEELDMPDATFYQKRKRKAWTADEIKKIAPMLSKQRGDSKKEGGEVSL